MKNEKKGIVVALAIYSANVFAASGSVSVTETGVQPASSITSDQAVIVGAGDVLAGTGGTSVGYASVTMNYGTAFGYLANAGTNAVAIGAYSSAGIGGTALGFGAEVGDNNNGVALGNGANAWFALNSVALGANTTAVRDNEVAVGGRTIGQVGAATANDQATNFQQVNSIAASTLSSAKSYADSAVSTLNTSLRGYTDSVASNTLSSANTYTNNAIAGLSIPSGGITQAQLDAAVSSAISTSQNYTNTAISGLAPGGAPQSYVDAKDASTLSSANGYTDQKKAEAVSESKTYTDTKATQTLKSANDYSDQVGSNTLIAANQFTTSEISKLNLNGASEQYVNNAVAQGVAQANSYTDQKFDQAKKYSYSAAAIGMASSSLVFNPNLARQVAIGASTVNGQQAVAIGVAVNLGRMSQVNVKGAYASGMGGASVGYTMGF
ncbi:hypothetical protein [Burkholderia cenocepacia]|uniref:hypothetical protein n=1 Tax=Burkholderia cenocepacia TaxID=95486 RepID=UPI002652BE1A|nr:hypothetical protein [Burkholderia cenocepacia]MDN7678057.1 hypothetical protein [Burkholderia cenocepacia]